MVGDGYYIICFSNYIPTFIHFNYRHIWESNRCLIISKNNCLPKCIRIIIEKISSKSICLICSPRPIEYMAQSYVIKELPSSTVRGASSQYFAFADSLATVITPSSYYPFSKNSLVITSLSSVILPKYLIEYTSFVMYTHHIFHIPLSLLCAIPFVHTLLTFVYTLLANFHISFTFI